MIARPASSFTLSSMLDRFGLTSLQRHVSGGYDRPLLNRWQRMFAALGEWSSVSLLTSQGEPLWRYRPERLRTSRSSKNAMQPSSGRCASGCNGTPKPRV